MTSAASFRPPLAVLSLAVLGLLGFAAAPAAIAQEKLSKDPIVIGVGVDPAYATFFLAAQNKDFEKAGLNVELLQFTQGGDAVDGLVAGQNQLVGSAEPTTLIRAVRSDMRILAVYGQSGSYIKFVARPGITDIKQAKKFGIVPASVSDFATGKMLAKYGIDEKSVQMISGGPPEFPALLTRGDVDGYFLWEPWPTNGVALGGKILTTSGDVGYSYNMWLSASGAWFDGHKAEARAILGVLAKSCNQVTSDPAKAAAATQAQAKIPADKTLDMLKEIQCKVRDFTPADIATYKEIAQFLVDRKVTPTKADVDKYLQVGFYKE
jgi:NitT/TauT family transport system substrate-binding protein